MNESASDPAVQALTRLVEIRGDPAELREVVRRLGGWDLQDAVVLTRARVIEVLHAFLRNEIDERVLRAWADALEFQDAVETEFGEIDTVLAWLAEPALSGPLGPNLVLQLIARLEGG